MVASMATFQNRFASTKVRRLFATKHRRKFCLSFLPLGKNAAKLRGAAFL
jgi:hypothetical protein